MISKQGILFFVCFWMLQLNVSLGQVWKYSGYEKKPVTYSEKITYRYIIKHNRFNTIHQIDSSGTDTILNSDGSIKSVTKHYQEIYSSADFQYPDSALYEKEVYNEKGLLICDEEYYHIHVDQPCFTQTYSIYDKHNREIQRNVFECDSFFHNRLTSEFDDSINLVKQKYFNVKHDYLEYLNEIKFDQLGRKEKILFIEEEGGKTEERGRTEFSYEEDGAKIVRKIYDGGKLESIHYWLYDKKGRQLSELDCWPPNDRHDTLVSSEILFKYDRKGNLVQKSYSSVDTKEEIHYTYGKKNRLIFEKQEYETQSWDKAVEKYAFTKEYRYRNDGLLDCMDVFQQDGEVVRYRYEYKFKR